MRRFDRVSSISPPMVERLAKKGVPEARRVLFPNWVTVTEATDEGPAGAESGSTLRRELGLVGKIVVMYSGNMGAKQGLETLAPLARSVAADSRLAFVFCGDGAYRPQLEADVAGLANVLLLPLQPAQRLGALLRTADVHLLLQRAGAADLVMPSKLAGMLASGRPVLATAEAGTEIARTVEGRGLMVAPGSLEALQAGLSRLAGDRDLRERLGATARSYAVENLAKDKILERFEAELMALVREGLDL